MTDRRGPKDGYDFANKRRYRRDIWGCFRKVAEGDGGERGHAMLLPSLEGEEVVQAMRRGWPQDRLHIVDDNPAIVATLRRTRFPDTHPYGVTLARAIKRAAKGGFEIRFVNADLCKPVSPGLLRTLYEIGRWTTEVTVAVTMLRGREDHRTSWWLDHHAPDHSRLVPLDGGMTRRKITPRDAARLELVAGALMADGYVVSITRAETERIAIYRSQAGTQTMLWAIFSRERDPNGKPFEHGPALANGLHHARMTGQKLARAADAFEKQLKVLKLHPSDPPAVRLMARKIGKTVRAGQARTAAAMQDVGRHREIWRLYDELLTHLRRLRRRTMRYMRFVGDPPCAGG